MISAAPSLLLFSLIIASLHLTQSSPLLVPLKSQLPPEPIENPADWAWGLHPDNGLDYSAKARRKARLSVVFLTCLSFRTGSQWSSVSPTQTWSPQPSAPSHWRTAWPTLSTLPCQAVLVIITLQEGSNIDTNKYPLLWCGGVRKEKSKWGKITQKAHLWEDV